MLSKYFPKNGYIFWSVVRLNKKCTLTSWYQKSRDNSFLTAKYMNQLKLPLRVRGGKRVKNKVIRIFLMIIMGILFIYYVFFVLNNDQVNKSFSFLTLISVVGVVIAIVSIYKSKLITIIFLVIPIYALMVISFVYSVLGNIFYFRYAMLLLIAINLIRIIRLGWTKENEQIKY